MLLSFLLILGAIIFGYRIYQIVNTIFVQPVALQAPAVVHPTEIAQAAPSTTQTPILLRATPPQVAAATVIPALASPTPIIAGSPPTPTVFHSNATWAGTSRLNILLMGIDQRDNEDPNTAHSDTMILLSIDPVQKTAIMLSIPRDLLVDVQGYQSYKITTYHAIGGSDLAVRAVEENFNIPISYWIEVNFHGFEQVVDLLGGVIVDAERPIYDDEYPITNDDNNVGRIYIPAGLQVMDGMTALRYVRSRHQDSDFGRMQRQQQVLWALRASALRQNPLDFSIANRFLDILNSGVVRTSIPINELPALYNLTKQVDSSAIASYEIDPNMVEEETDAVNGDYLAPNWDLIRPFLQRILTSNPRIEHEQAKIQVLNGTATPGLAQQLTDQLQTAGYTTLDPAAAASTAYQDTVIIMYSDKPATADALAQLLDIPSSEIRRQTVAHPPADIVIIAGKNTRLP